MKFKFTYKIAVIQKSFFYFNLLDITRLGLDAGRRLCIPDLNYQLTVRHPCSGMDVLQRQL